jgi:hypothetical protein
LPCERGTSPGGGQFHRYLRAHYDLPRDIRGLALLTRRSGKGYEKPR